MDEMADLFEQVVEIRQQVWQEGFKAGFAKGVAEVLAEFKRIEDAPIRVAAGITTAPQQPTVVQTAPKPVAIEREEQPKPIQRQFGNNVRELILNFVNKAPGPVTAGQFSRLNPHISASTRFDVARKLGEEGLIIRDYETWSRAE